MPMTSLLIGNFFSLLSATSLAVSVAKKSKKDLIWWQIWDAVFGMMASFFLNAYAAAVICIVYVIRNVLAYQDRLTKNKTIFLMIAGGCVGWYANNLGVIGWLPIIAAVGYTACIYLSKNEQQLRWALIASISLWIIHNVYVRAYPYVILDSCVTVWTFIQIYKNRKSFAV